MTPQFPGRSALHAYYAYLGATPEEIRVMLDEPDRPARALPGGVPPRVLESALARFAADRLGPGWGAIREVPHRPFDGETPGDAAALQDVPIIALTGRRRTGKSSLSDRLCRLTGYVHAHPFNAGKALIRAWLESVGADAETAERMTNGDLKDAPTPLLPPAPDGSPRSPRFVMEELGAFMPNDPDLGHEWTLGAEIARRARDGAAGVVLSSAAHEAVTIAGLPGSVIIRVTSDEEMRFARAGGVNLTDLACDDVRADLEFHNDMDGPAVLDRWEAFLITNGIVDSPRDTPEP